MSGKQNGQLYNLKAVVRQTGVKPDTLRAWERRYGLPDPQRSEGRHRLYSKRDIETILWLVARQKEGLSIKRAVGQWRELESEGRDPLPQAPQPAMAGATSVTSSGPGQAIVQLRSDWLDAALAYDETRAEQVLSQAFARYSPETVFLELLQPAVSEVGKRWIRGSVSVQQEHFTSEMAIRRIEALIASAPQPNKRGRVLAACPPMENHTFGLLLLTFLLRRRGWDVIYLGANVPADQLDTTIGATKPDQVILAAQQFHTAASLLDLGAVFESHGVPMAYGGLVFNQLPELRSRIPGFYLGESVQAALENTERLLTGWRPEIVPVDPVPEVFLQAKEYYTQVQPRIEIRLAGLVDGSGLAPAHLALANHELGLNIQAGLRLGDVGHVGYDLGWIRELLRSHQMPEDVLDLYLNAYSQAAKLELDERGQPVVDWLAKVAVTNGLGERDE